MQVPRKIKLKSIRKKILSFIKAVFPFHAAAWKASSEPIRHILEEPDGDVKDKLTVVWKDSIQAQLNTVSITVSTQNENCAPNLCLIDRLRVLYLVE
jgi:hypothetical protein